MNEETRSVRADSDCFCPRVNEHVVILSGVCLFKGVRIQCSGCIFDTRYVYVKLVFLLCDILTCPKTAEVK